MTPTPYQEPLDQAFLRLWIGLYGPDSRLSQYLRPEPAAPPEIRPPQRDAPACPSLPRPRRLPVSKARARKTSKIDGEARRVADMSLPAWAMNLIGDELITGITLDALLESIDDYFNCFLQMRRVNRAAYQFFTRVGAPVVTAQSAVWTKHADMPRFPTAHLLPAYFGVFMGRSPEEAREMLQPDAPGLPDFFWFEKVANAPTVATAGSAIFSMNSVYLRRNGLLSPEEERRLPWARRNLGMYWYVGIDRDGEVQALPMRMQHSQRLPRSPRKNPEGGLRSGTVHRSSFGIPDGLYELGNGNPHQWVRRMFCCAVAFAATASYGLQVAFRRGKVTARIGIPITNARDFFADRDVTDGERRAAILHLRRPHERHLADGRVIQVGAHLAGQRQFAWHGYDVSVGAPGLHYPAPEGFTDALYDAEEAIPEGLALSDTTKMAKLMSGVIWKPRRTRFRHGRPTREWTGNSFALPETPPAAAGGE